MYTGSVVATSNAAAAGTASLAISIVAVAAGLGRYGRMRLLPARHDIVRIAVPMGLASVVGAIPGGIIATHAPDAGLKIVLGLILVAAALKTLRA